MYKKLVTKVSTMLISLSMCLTNVIPYIPSTAMAADIYSVTFDAGGGHFKNASGTTQYNKISITDSDGDGAVTVTYPFNVASQSYSAIRNGYELSGWAYGVDTIPASKLNGTTISLTGNRTYTAIWQGQEYEITFQDVNGQNVGNTRTMRLGDANDLSLTALGYSEADLGIQNNFIGWEYTSSDGGTIFLDGHDVTVHDFTDSNDEPLFDKTSIKLKAVDAASTEISITFDGNEGTGAMNAQTLKYGTDTRLSANKFTRQNYKFIGWSLSPDDTTPSFTEGQETTCNFGLAHNTIFYAIWAPDSPSDTSTYSVQFIQNVVNTEAGSTRYINHEADTLTKVPKQYYNSSVSALSESLPYQQGFYVSGFHLVRLDTEGKVAKKSKKYHPGSKWSLNEGRILIESSDGKFTEKLEDFVSPDGCIYLLPVWTAITVRASYAPNTGGEGQSPEALEVTLGRTLALENNTYTNTSGKSFMGWAIDASATADHMYTSGSTADSTMVYPAGYRIRSTLDSEQTYGLFTDPFSKYLDVRNWTSAFATSTYFKDGVLDLTEYPGYKIYAIWDDNTYTIHYDINKGTLSGASGSMADQTVKVNSQTALTANGFAITGYGFQGWNTKADGTGERYSDRQSVLNLAARNATVTLYAQWSKNAVATIPLVVEQKWNDQSNQDGLRPNTMAYTVTATANNKQLTASDLGLTTLTFQVESGASTKTLAQVPKSYLINGAFQTISYNVSTTVPTNYTSTVEYKTDASGIKTLYTFTHTPATKNFTVTVKISDSNNQDGKRPKNVKIVLRGSDGSSNQASVTIAGDTTTYTFEHVPVYANGSQITYTVEVSESDGYTSSITNSGNASTITLSHTPEVMTISVKAQWKDDDNAAKLRPSTINASFVSTSGTSSSVRLSESSAWSASIDRIAKYYQGGVNNGSLTVTPVENYTATVSGSASAGFTITMTLSALAKKQAAAKNDSAADSSSSKAKTATPKPVTAPKEELRSITVRTIWNDNEMDYLRPLYMSITLIGSDGKKYDRMLSSTTGYSTVFNDLPVKDKERDDKEIEYKIGYSPIKGYTTHIYHNRKNKDEFIIENFMPKDSSIIDTSMIETEDGQIAQITQKSISSEKDKPPLITIGAPSDDTLYANEDGSLREADVTVTKDKPVENLLDKLPNKKLLIPGAIVGGILAIGIALIIFFISRRE